MDEPVTVYNLKVADYHAYYVTDIGTWVHNIECTISANNLASLVKIIRTYITENKALELLKNM